MASREFLYSFVEKVLFRRFPKVYRALYSLYKARSDGSERAVFRKYIRAGDVVADVGSNIGIYTQYFADIVGAGGSVHAFEPEPHNFGIQSKALAGRSNVKLNHAAVGATSGTIHLHISPKLNVDHRTYATGDGRDSVPVPCCALDDYFAPGSRVDFIKIDIQGFEYQALQGMDRVLNDNPAVKLLLEYFPEGLRTNGVETASLRAFLIARKFRLFEISPDGEIPLGDSEPGIGSTGYTNLFAAR